MKKIFSTLAAFAALVGLFASCNPEEIETTFKPQPATATIDVKVIYAAIPAEVTSQATVVARPSNSNNVSVNYANGVVTLKGEDGIPEMSVLLDVTYKNEAEPAPLHASTVVEIAKVKVGGIASYAASVIIGSAAPAGEYEMVKIDSKSDFKENAVFDPSHGIAIAHDGKIWAANETPFMLKTNINYLSRFGAKSFKCVDQYNPLLPADKAAVDSYFDAVSLLVDLYDDEVESILPIQVSAWAMYTVYVAEYDCVDTYMVRRVSGSTTIDLAKIEVFGSSTVAQYEEKALDYGHGHVGHYQEGHGQIDNHGASNNAGGGIIWAD